MFRTTLLHIIIALATLIFFASCSNINVAEQIKHNKWEVHRPMLQAGEKVSFDNIAVKDPSIVHYNGKYHLFYTSKSLRQQSGEREFETGFGYVSAPELEGLKHAKRYNMNNIVGENLIAVQVFYFEPQKLWYVVGHKKVSGKPNLAPVYITNTDIEDVYGWSEPRILETGKTNDEFWIDFWVICDDTNAYLFYSNQKGSVLRMQCPVNEFPQGFADAEEETVFTIKGKDENGKWIMFEAQHIYYVKKYDKYLMVAECAYWDDVRNHYIDPRNRFLIGLIADNLEGTWRRIEKTEDKYFAQAGNLYNPDGGKSDYTQVSHPELIRSGYNQRLETDDFEIRMIFQGFDGSQTPDDYIYDELPWELSVMQNF